MIKKGTLEKTLSGAAIGLILGGAYGFFRGFISAPGFLERLSPRPECFEVDQEAAKIFFELGKYRYHDEKAYVEALHNMDSLFCLELQLRHGEVKPQIQDPLTARDYAVRCLTQLRIMMHKVNEDNIHSEVKKWVQSLEKLCETHVHNVELLCRNI